MSRALDSINSKIAKVPELSSAIKFLTNLKTRSLALVPVSPSRKLLFQAGVISLTAVIVSSLTPGSTFTASSMWYSTDYINSYSIAGDVLVTDENGYLVKINPQTDDTHRIGLTDFAIHTVESGETLGLIAARYGVDVKTVMWENNLTNANSIRSGQKLLVPPVDGIGYKTASSDTLDKIAEKYDISVDAIIAQNNLGEDAIISKGQNLFLPGAIPIAPPVIIGDVNRNINTGVTVRNVDYSNISSSSSAPTVGKVFIYPTKGGITQGYHGGHLAIDIADRSKPPIWAAGGGTVSKVSTGTWGGGYGNHVMIDHGNGLKTLYAHMDSVNVSVGQWVNQGDVIGIMGNTGRVYGVTGIHLHWEVIDNGVKQNPTYYF